MPVILSFKVNGSDAAFVEPGQMVRLEWNLSDVEHFRLALARQRTTVRHDPVCRRPAGYPVRPWTVHRQSPRRGHLSSLADGPCGHVTSSVKVRLRKVPLLEIEGIEITQAIQTFRDPASPPDTRIRSSLTKTPSFEFTSQWRTLAVTVQKGVADEVAVSGELRLVGPSLPTSLPPLKLLGNRPPRARPH